MNEINFLPDTYFRRARVRRRVVLEALLVLLVAAGLTLWGFQGRQKVAQLREQAHSLETEGATVQQQIKSFSEIQAELQSLQQKLKIHREVALPVTYTQLIGALARFMPPSVALVELTIEGRRPTPGKADPAESERSKKQGPRKGDAPANAAQEPLRIDLVGISPNDDRIADFVGRLADFPVFTDVKLEFTRTVESDGIIGRQFGISMRVPLNREYRPLDTRENVANAD